MPALHSEISHNLENSAVRCRLDSMLESIRIEYAGMVSDLQGAWEGDTLHISFNAYGFEIASEVHISPQRIEWDGHVPSRANLFVGKIQRTIHSKLSDMLHAAHRDQVAAVRRAA